MKLSYLIHAPTRASWIMRLLVYIAICVTVTFVVQILMVLFW